MVRRHGRSAGGVSRLGMPLLAPAGTSSRKTPWRSSTSASPLAAKDALRLHGEDELAGAAFAQADVGELGLARGWHRRRGAARERSMSLPANMRRGNGIGGSTSSATGRPSPPSAVGFDIRQKYVQWAPGGTGSPGLAAALPAARRWWPAPSAALASPRRAVDVLAADMLAQGSMSTCIMAHGDHAGTK